MSTVAQRIDSIVEDFADLEGREKLELLLEFAARLPALPPTLHRSVPAATTASTSAKRRSISGRN